MKLVFKDGSLVEYLSSSMVFSLKIPVLEVGTPKCKVFKGPGSLLIIGGAARRGMGAWRSRGLTRHTGLTKLSPDDEPAKIKK